MGTEPADFPKSIERSALQFLQRGCMATVYRIKSQPAFVIKLQDTTYHHNEKRVYERLGRHPRIAAFYGEAAVQQSSDLPSPGLLFGLVPNGTLRETLEGDIGQSRAKRPGQVTLWSAQLLDGLSYIHSRSVIHGDFGAHNVLVGLDWGLVITDFAGSRLDGSPCLAGPSPAYRRPTLVLPPDAPGPCEPTEGDDIYAFGTVLYEMSEGALLYRAITRDSVLASFTAGLYPDLSSMSALPRSVVLGCWKCQYSSARRVAGALGLS
ncbi:kinase-like domain-containing protein [Lasiosphaeria hispida]|uniref:Kinase-like domain-containing protein n=1 Tax=Lasiosphaeria hispida TaxID=260671 RepID=A0AAJ0MH37_9PEZI|nr:kinase-like domain-containing protein [Lasiosphaeria hispida]